MNVVVIGIGNAYRRDDGVAFAVLGNLREVAPTAARYVELDGESLRLIDAWTGADVAIVIDACRSGAPPGTVQHVDLERDLDRQPLPALPGLVSGHAAGIAEALHLARALERLPRRLVAIAIEAEDLGPGTELSAPVVAAVAVASRAVLKAITASCDTAAS